MKKNKILKVTGGLFASVAALTPLTAILASCKMNDKIDNILPPIDLPVNPSNPSKPTITVKKSDLLVSKNKNDFNQLTQYSQPSETILNNNFNVDVNKAPILISKDYFQSLSTTKEAINKFKNDNDLYKNIYSDLTKKYVENLKNSLNVTNNDFFVNLKNDIQNKKIDIVVQITNSKNALIKNEQIQIKPNEFYAIKFSVNYKNATFEFDQLNKLVVTNIEINAKQDNNGNISDVNNVDFFNINNKPWYFNTSAINVSENASNSLILNKWLNTNFESQDIEKTILANINQSIKDKFEQSKIVADNAQIIGNMLANNVTISEFLVNIGEPIGNILSLFNSTKPYSELVKDLFSSSSNADAIIFDINKLIKEGFLPSQASMVTDVINNLIGNSTFVNWLLNVNLDEYLPILNTIVEYLPTQIKEIVNISIEYINIIKKIATTSATSIGQVKILSSITDPSIIDAIPSLLNKIKNILNTSQQSTIDKILLLWNEIKTNWNLTNVQGLLTNIFNPKINNGVETPLNEALKQSISLLIDEGTIVKNNINSYNIKQKNTININETIAWDLSPLKKILSGVSAKTISQVFNLGIDSYAGVIGNIDKLLPDIFELTKGDSLSIDINDQNAILKPTINGYDVIANQYININMPQSLDKCYADILNNFGWATKNIIKLFADPYVKSIKNYYFGYPFAINSPLHIENSNISSNLGNVFDGTNTININPTLLDELKNTTIPSFIQNEIGKLTDKKNIIIEPNIEIIKQINQALGLMSQDISHIQIFVQPAMETTASIDKNPKIANAWINVEFNCPLLDISNPQSKHWINSIVIDGLNIANINTIPSTR